MRSAVTTCLVLVCWLGFSPQAQAEDGCEGELNDAIAWSVAAFEVGFATSLGLRLTETVDQDATGGEAILQTIPWGAAALLGIGSFCLELSHEPATAVHGALWTGFNFFLLGAIVDGVDGKGGELGTGTVVLTSVGVLAGGVFGATQVSDDSDSWGFFFGSAPAALMVTIVAEGVFAIVDFLSTGGDNFDTAFLPIAFGVMTLGVGTMSIGTLVVEDAFAAGHPEGPAHLMAGTSPSPAILKLDWQW